MKNLYNYFFYYALLALLFIISCSEVKQPPGAFAPDIPSQKSITNDKIWDHNSYNFTALAKFDLRAKVLGKERYRYDRESDLSPYDLALGWGRMSDQSVVDRLDISQSNRWYYWQTDHFPIPRKEIEKSSANMHIIPANEEVEDVLSDIRVGEIILLEGYLVSIMSDDGWRWKSSLSRDDTGNGACEVIWVEKLLRLK